MTTTQTRWTLTALVLLVAAAGAYALYQSNNNQTMAFNDTYNNTGTTTPAADNAVGGPYQPTPDNDQNMNMGTEPAPANTAPASTGAGTGTTSTP